WKSMNGIFALASASSPHYCKAGLAPAFRVPPPHFALYNALSGQLAAAHGRIRSSGKQYQVPFRRSGGEGQQWASRHTYGASRDHHRYLYTLLAIQPEGP